MSERMDDEAGRLLMGPVLLFRGTTETDAGYAVLAVTPNTAQPPARLWVRLGGNRSDAAPATPLLSAPDGRTLWRTEFRVALDDEIDTFDYGIEGDDTWTVALPRAGRPQRVAWTACNGTEKEDRLPPGVDRDAMWRDLARVHDEQPFHLLLQGGDQLYADSIWGCCRDIIEWRRIGKPARFREPFTAAMDKAVSAYYFDRYMTLWNRPGTSRLLASVPNLMMWDDHDIFDGWGSHPDDAQNSSVYQGIYACARRAFMGFQLGLPEHGRLADPFLDEEGRTLSWAVRLGSLGILAPDLRAERSRDMFMGPDTWTSIEKALKSLEGVKDLFLISTVPLLHVSLRPLERLFFLLPGEQFFQDDLRDQWQSYAHKDAWRRMVDALLTFKSRTGARIVSLSGEIHLGGRGYLTSPQGPIHQLISSGVIHPAPPQIAATLLGLLGRLRKDIMPGVTYSMEPIPGFDVRYLAARNWLELESSVSETPWRATWHAEGWGTSLPLVLP